jgi:hypothetical protein
MCLILIGIYIYKREMWSIIIGQFKIIELYITYLGVYRNTPPKTSPRMAVCQKTPDFRPSN